mgnify:CR=1 FL=1|jgi:hypothetical protein
MDTIENWLQTINKAEEEKDFFYKLPTTKFQLEFFYISTSNSITRKENVEVLLDTNNKLSKNEFIYLISKNKPSNYRLLDILVYQMTLPANELEYIDHFEGLKSIKCIDDIHFENVIDYFKDLTTVYVLLYEKNKKYNTTRKVHINLKHRNTKRIY